MTFGVSVRRFEFSVPGLSSSLPTSQPTLTNLLRGALGAALYSRQSLYSKWFDPHWREGPSGYRNAPRPFVLRPTAAGINLITFEPGFSTSELDDTLQAAIHSVTGGTQVQVHPRADLQLPLRGCDKSGRLRLEFVTPVELKSKGRIAAKPRFPVLIDRLVERIWTLGRLYQNWPEQAELTHLISEAHQVEVVAHNWMRLEGQRRSARSAQLHSIGGFTGWAEYSGPIGQFLPLLEIGRWTGVGRQTVWGKGEIRVTSFTEQP